MRKAFNFYKSFYDVYKELSKSDRVEYMDALLARQFEGKEPDNLKGMAKFAYKSQEQVVNQQIEGWERKTGLILKDTAYQGGSQRGAQKTIPTPLAQGEGEEEVQGEEKVQEKVKYIVEYLNSVSNKNYKPSTDKTKTLIKARLNEGFDVEDFYKVIDTKCKQWLNTDQSIYIRPETLFGNKFEGYLNEQVNNNFNDRVYPPTL